VWWPPNFSILFQHPNARGPNRPRLPSKQQNTKKIGRNTICPPPDVVLRCIPPPFLAISVGGQPCPTAKKKKKKKQKKPRQKNKKRKQKKKPRNYRSRCSSGGAVIVVYIFEVRLERARREKKTEPFFKNRQPRTDSGRARAFLVGRARRKLSTRERRKGGKEKKNRRSTNEQPIGLPLTCLGRQGPHPGSQKQTKRDLGSILVPPHAPPRRRLLRPIMQIALAFTKSTRSQERDKGT